MRALREVLSRSYILQIKTSGERVFTSQDIAKQFKEYYKGLCVIPSLEEGSFFLFKIPNYFLSL